MPHHQHHIDDRKTDEGMATEDFNSGKAAIGTGPFRFASYKPGDRVELERFDGYWDDKPAWQHIDYRFITNDASRTAALLAGVVDAARRTPADRLLLEVREDNSPALSFYAGQGFVEIDRRPRYYRDGTTAVVLRRPLVRGCGGSEL